MANFLIVVDPDIERRSLFASRVEPMLSLIDGLQTASCVSGHFYAAWSAPAAAPVSHTADDSGAAIIWGEAIGEKGPERLEAASIRSLWSKPSSDAPPVLNGYFAAAVFQYPSTVIFGADLLGLFPVYYFHTESVLLAGSSPELFRHHPAFQQDFNPAGLVGLLLTNGLFDGQTLTQGVQRLSAGHQLVWRADEPSAEIQNYAVPVSTQYFSFPYLAQIDQLDKTLDDAMTRHVPAGDSYSFLLSGGLDSRTLAGYLGKNGIDAAALTWGLATDFEMKCAIQVARTLGFEHHTADVSSNQYPFYAEHMAKWEHLAGGFNSVIHWGLCSHLGKLAPRTVTGYLADAIIGGSHIAWAYSPLSATMSFDTFFSRMNAWGIQPKVLKRLLRREVFGDLVDETVDRIRAVYESYGEHESQRAWCFDLYHRQRFGVGGLAWQLSFGAWPILPVVDQGVMETAGAMPAAVIAERRAQIDLVCNRFPRMAQLPLDRSSNDIRPLKTRLRHQLPWYFRNLLGSYSSRLSRITGHRNVERRYVFRLLDFNSPGWRAIRHRAEPSREAVFHLLDRDELEKVLPDPTVSVQFENALSGPSGLKLLLGLLLYSEDHL